MLYILIYILLVISKLAAGSRARNAVFYIWIVVLLVFAGTREWTGCDFAGYLRRFETYNSVDFDTYRDSREIGFIALNYLIIRLGLGYMWVNLAASAIFLFGLCVFARRREDPLGYLALCFPILVVQLGMSGIRQAIAVGILFLAFNAFVDGKRIRFALFVVIATLSHASAMVVMPLLLAVGREPTVVRLVGATVLIAPVAMYLSGGAFDTYQSRYLEKDVEAFGAIFRVGLISITAIFFELNRRAYQTKYPEDFGLMRIFSIASFALVAILMISTLAAHRLGFFITPVQLLILARLPTAMQIRQKNKLLEGVPYLVYFAYISVWFGLSRHAQGCYVPYDSYLF